MIPTLTPTPGLWATPTMFPVTPGTPEFSLDGQNVVIAEGLVQGYQLANQSGALDIIFFVLVLVLIVGGLWTVIRHLQKI